MGFRFRRSIRLLPGVRLNVSKSGVSTSLGTRGAWLTFGPRGTRATVGIPGSGISYTETSGRPQEHAPAEVNVQHVLPAFEAPVSSPEALPNEMPAAAQPLHGEDRALVIAISAIVGGIVVIAVLLAIAVTMNAPATHARISSGEFPGPSR